METGADGERKRPAETIGRRCRKMSARLMTGAVIIVTIKYLEGLSAICASIEAASKLAATE